MVAEAKSKEVVTESQATGEDQLTPAEVVQQLDSYIIAQDDAKRAVAIALRNRWRRLRVSEDFREEITPKNIIMIGATGVGKTEISRRLAKLVRAPFVKVEASKFTEVGYVGRDVESIIRDLVETSVNLVREEERERVAEQAEQEVEERILDLLLPGSRPEQSTVIEGNFTAEEDSSSIYFQDEEGVAHAEVDVEQAVSGESTREKLKKLLREGKFEDREVEVEITKHASTQMQVLGPQGFSEIEGQIKEMFSNMVPPQKDVKRMTVAKAREALQVEVQEGLVDQDRVTEIALSRAEESGIVFIDEIDKVCGHQGTGKGPDISREGVQRDLLPLVEGSTVSTKYGPVSTDHILFVASGAFHISKPSDLMPEFQGRFPIRVELETLTSDHFYKILTEPKNALTKQYIELMLTEGVELEFTDGALRRLAELTAEVNSRMENIGARRLHTVLEKLLEDLSYSANTRSGEHVTIDEKYVDKHLADIVQDTDLSKYIL